MRSTACACFASAFIFIASPAGAQQTCPEQKLASPNGPGVRVSANCRREEGTFIDGRLWGQGKYTDEYGSVFEGQFVRGRLHGYGRLTEAQVFGGNWHEGMFQNGDALGPGRARGNGNVIHTGYFHRQGLHGAGMMTFANGVRLGGEFRNGSGFGAMVATLPDGKKETGDFRTLFNKYAYYPLPAAAPTPAPAASSRPAPQPASTAPPASADQKTSEPSTASKTVDQTKDAVRTLRGIVGR